MAGVAQSHIHVRFAWQAWDNLTSTFVLRGRRGIHGTVSSAWDGLAVSRGRRGTISHTIFHTQLCHTPSVTQLRRTPSFTHNFVMHHLSHTTLSHTTLSHTTLSHTTPLQPQLQLVSQVKLVICIQRCGHTHHLSHTTLSHTTLSHTTLSHTTPLQPQLQLVSQVRLVICIQFKDAVIGSSIAALVVLAQNSLDIKFMFRLPARLPSCVSDMFYVPGRLFHRSVLACLLFWHVSLLPSLGLFHGLPACLPSCVSDMFAVPSRFFHRLVLACLLVWHV